MANNRSLRFSAMLERVGAEVTVLRLILTPVGGGGTSFFEVNDVVTAICRRGDCFFCCWSLYKASWSRNLSLVAAKPAVELVEADPAVREDEVLAAKLTDRAIGRSAGDLCMVKDFCFLAGVIRLRRPRLMGANTTLR